MSIDPLIVVLIVVVALFVAASVARRAGEHADRLAGRRAARQAQRRGPVGAVLDLLDESVAAYTIRRRLGLSTKTRAERRAEAVRAALVAQVDEIRRLRGGGVSAVRPAHLVVAGRGRGARTLPRRSSTLPYELVAAVIGFVLVVGLVMAIWPRGSGGVLSATGTPAASRPAIATPTLSQAPAEAPPS